MKRYRSRHKEPNSKSHFFGTLYPKNLIRKRIEVVITGLTRNQVVLTGSWVRIPPAPPSKNPVTMRVSGFFFFCVRSKNHPVLGCSFHNFGKNSFLLYSPLFFAFCSHHHSLCVRQLWRIVQMGVYIRRRKVLEKWPSLVPTGKF